MLENQKPARELRVMGDLPFDVRTDGKRPMAAMLLDTSEYACRVSFEAPFRGRCSRSSAHPTMLLEQLNQTNVLQCSVVKFGKQNNIIVSFDDLKFSLFRARGDVGEENFDDIRISKALLLVVVVALLLAPVSLGSRPALVGPPRS